MRVIRRALHLTIVVAGTWFIAPGAAHAQDAAEPPPAEPPPAPPADAPVADAPPEEEAPPKKTIDVRVQGQRKVGSASQTTVERDVIRAAPHHTASDAMAVVPGFAVTQHSGQGKAHQIFFRGFDAQHGQDVEITVGGVPINEVSNLHGQGYADLHFVMPEIIERIESLPGTYDPRQGDFAVAGSLRFVLGYDEPGFTASGSVGMFGERRLFLAYNPADAGSETFVAVEGQTTSGFGPSRAARRVSAVGQMGVDLGDVAHVRLLASVYAARFAAAGVLTLDDALDADKDRFATYDASQGGDSVRAQVAAEFTRQGNDEEAKDHWSLMPFFVARKLKLRHDFTGYFVDPVNGDNTQQKNDSNTVGAVGSYTRRFDFLSPRDQVSLGFFGRSDFIEQRQIRLSQVDDRTTSRLVDASVVATNVAGWVEAEATAWKRLRMRAGVRLDGTFYAAEDRTLADAGVERSAMGFHVGPKASADVLVVSGLNAVASFGTGFRSAQARSLADGEKSPNTEVISFEGGVRYSRGPELAAKAAVFHTRLSDDLVFDEELARNEPVPSTARTGFVLDVSSRPTPWFTTSASVTYSHAEFTEGDAEYGEGDLVPYTPQLVARTDMAISPRLGTVFERALVLRAGVGLSLFALRPLPFSEIGHDVFLADATIGLRLKEIEIRADAFNLLDARWFDGEFTYASNFERSPSPSLVPRRHVTVGAPFTFVASASVYL